MLPFTTLADPLIGGRLTILIYHRVREVRDELFPDEVDARLFEQQLQALGRYFAPLAVGEAVERLQRGTLPRRAVCITFDDGYADNLHVAAPILQRTGIPAAFFIAADFLDGGRMWNDTLIEAVARIRGPRLSTPSGHSLDVADISGKRAAIELLLREAKYLPPRDRATYVARVVESADVELPGNLMLTSAELRQLHRLGMEIGAHTCSHPILTSLDRDQAAGEILRSKQVLESIIGEPLQLFAYPNGRPLHDYGRVHAALARDAGFRAAFSTAPGYADPQSDEMQLPRFTPWDRSPMRFVARLLGNFFKRQSSLA